MSARWPATPPGCSTRPWWRAPPAAPCSSAPAGTWPGSPRGLTRRPWPRWPAAISLFPFLAAVRAIRAYTGFRPASPDHLPIIGADAAVPGLFHATGHEGAGIGLAPATAELVTALIDGARPPMTVPPVDGAPFTAARFARAFPQLSARRDDGRDSEDMCVKSG